MSGLNLGHVPFPPGYQPYTSPERRRRKRAAARRAAGGGTAGGGAVRNRGGAVSPYVPFLGVQRERIRGALGASVGSHVVGIALALLVTWAGPAEEVVEIDRPNYIGMVWIPQPGPGGGGGGGGNESLEMPQLVEVVGEDALSVPIEVPPEVEAPPEVEPDPEPLESQNRMQLSALPMAAAQQTRAGLLESLLARSLNSAGSGTDGGAGEGDGGGIGPGQGDGLGSGEGGGVGGGPFRPGNGVESPRPIREVQPRYTAEAMRAKVQGEVWLEAVVLPDGTVGDVRVTRSLDRNFGLDEEAIKAAKQWRFAPGTRFGEPVAVLVTLAISFTLR